MFIFKGPWSSSSLQCPFFFCSLLTEIATFSSGSTVGGVPTPRIQPAKCRRGHFCRIEHRLVDESVRVSLDRKGTEQLVTGLLVMYMKDKVIIFEALEKPINTLFFVVE